MKVDFRKSRLCILICLLVILSFILSACWGHKTTEEELGEGCVKVGYFVEAGFEINGNDVCRYHAGTYTECSNNPGPICRVGLGIFNPLLWPQCIRASTCADPFGAVEIEVICCEPGAGEGIDDGADGGEDEVVCNENDVCDEDSGETIENCPADCTESQTTTLTCSGLESINRDLEPTDENWRCCQGNVIQDGDITCCDGELKRIFPDIFSEAVQNSALGGMVSYRYRADPAGPYFSPCIEEEGVVPLECAPILGARSSPTGDANVYSFSRTSEDDEVTTWSEKLLFCEAQCNVLMSSAVDSAVESGECEVEVLISEGGEPTTEITSCAVDESFSDTSGEHPGICEFGNLRWLDSQGEPLESARGTETFGEGDVLPGQEVILAADLDSDCTEENSRAEFNIKKHFDYADESYTSVEPMLRVGRRDVLARWAPPWEDVEGFFDVVEDPRFVFEAIAITTGGDEAGEERISCISPVLTITRPPRDCGNGHLDPDGADNIPGTSDDEECDEGDANSVEGTCNLNCKKTACGDGSVQSPNWDGVQEVCDGGTEACTTADRGYSGARTCLDTCLGYETTCNTNQRCGDGRVNGDENCDEGDDLNGQPNHCNSECTGMTGSECRNGVPENGEECDDGNNNPNDDCTNGCADAECGDGIIWNEQGGNEECDLGIDKNDGSYGGCKADCTLPNYCGDGTFQSDHEECDDGNDEAEDGCDASCQIEEGWTCDTDVEPSECMETAELCHIFNPVWRDENGFPLEDGAHVTGTAEEDGYTLGDTVFVSVEGDEENCEGKTTTFEIYEIADDDAVFETIADIEFYDGREYDMFFRIWLPPWFEKDVPFGEDPDPAYWFVVEASVSDDGPLTSGLLEVDRPDYSQCNDDSDNDGDGLIDLDDPGCDNINDDYEGDATSECQDGSDNDNDNLIDWDGGRNEDDEWVEGDPGCCDDPRYGRCDARDDSEYSA